MLHLHHQIQLILANRKIGKAASKSHASSIMLEVSNHTTIHQLTTTSTTEPTDIAASELIIADQASI